MKLDSDPYLSAYKMDHPRRGDAIIFNHVNFDNDKTRTGSDLDVALLEPALKELKFEVKVYKDFTVDQVQSAVRQLANKNHEDCDCVLVVMLSHGFDDEIKAKDKLYKVHELWTPFLPDNCPSLAGKPKIFLIQACRGKDVDQGQTVVQSNGSYDTDNVGYRTAFAADFLVAYSSVKGYVSWLSHEKGSMFINAFCEVLKREPSLDLLKMLVRVNREVTMKTIKNVIKQIPQINCTLTRDVIFRPEESTTDIQNRDLPEEINNMNMSSDSHAAEVPGTSVGKKRRAPKPKVETDGSSKSTNASLGPTLAVRSKEDKHDVFARHVATSMRDMEQTQCIHVESIVSTAITHGKLRRLKDESQIVLKPGNVSLRKKKQLGGKPSTSSVKKRRSSGAVSEPAPKTENNAAD